MCDEVHGAGDVLGVAGEAGRALQQCRDQFGYAGPVDHVAPLDAGTPGFGSLGGQEVFGGHAELGSKPRRPLADQHHVWQLVHHAACDRDGVAVAPQCADGASAQAGAIHDRGIEFDLAEQVGVAAIADRMISGIVLDQARGSFDGIERRAARRENLPCCIHAD